MVKVMTTEDKKRLAQEVGIEAEVLEELKDGDVLLLRGNYLDRVIENYVVNNFKGRVLLLALPWADEDIKKLYYVGEELFKDEQTLKAFINLVYYLQDVVDDELTVLEEEIENFKLIRELEELENDGGTPSRQRVEELVYKSKPEPKVLDIRFTGGKNSKSAYALVEVLPGRLKIFKYKGIKLKARNDYVEEKIRKCIEEREGCGELPIVEDITAERSKYIILIVLEDGTVSFLDLRDIPDEKKEYVEPAIRVNPFVKAAAMKTANKNQKCKRFHLIPLEGKSKASEACAAEDFIKVYESLKDAKTYEELFFKLFRICMLIYGFAVYSNKDRGELEVIRKNRELLQEFTDEIFGRISAEDYKPLIVAMQRAYRLQSEDKFYSKVLIKIFEQVIRNLSRNMSKNPAIRELLIKAERENNFNPLRKDEDSGSSDEYRDRVYPFFERKPDFVKQVIEKVTVEEIREKFWEVLKGTIVDYVYSSENEEERVADRNPAGFIVGIVFMRFLYIYRIYEDTPDCIGKRGALKEISTVVAELLNEKGVPAFYTESFLKETIDYLSSAIDEDKIKNKTCEEVIRETVDWVLTTATKKGIELIRVEIDPATLQRGVAYRIRRRLTEEFVAGWR